MMRDRQPVIHADSQAAGVYMVFGGTSAGGDRFLLVSPGDLYSAPKTTNRGTTGCYLLIRRELQNFGGGDDAG
jgi:hypothetical protein